MLSYPPSPISIARAIACLCAPTTGERAAGELVVRSTSGTTRVPCGAYLIPVIAGERRDDLLFKVGAGPNRPQVRDGVVLAADAPEGGVTSWWTVSEAGALVSAVSALGGERFNLPAGTKFLFDPPLDGVEVEASAYRDFAGGASATHFGAARDIVQFEQLNAPQVTLDAFRSRIAELPGVIIVWDGSQPADGQTQSTLMRGRTRVGKGSQLMREDFSLFVLSKREDGGGARGAEGLQLLSDLTCLLTDRQEVDGVVVSAPTGLQVLNRLRVAGDSAVYQSVFVYVLRITATCSIQPFDSRTFAPWMRANVVTQTNGKEPTGEPLETTSQDVVMGEA